MRANEIKPGGYYVREEKGILLHFYDVTLDRDVRFHSYDLHDGKHRYTSSCALGTMMQWVDREATTVEISRVQPREPIVDVFERGSSPLRYALRDASGS